MRIFTINAICLRRNLKKIFLVISVVLIFTVAFFVFSELIDAGGTVFADSDDVGRVIIIDAGHGGEDSGAIGANGALEKDLNLAVATELGNILKEKGYTVVYTRTSDKMLYSEEENIKGMRKLSDLKNRCAFAENYPDALFISIHMNTYGASKYSGLQVYYSDGNNESERLASSVQRSVKENLQKNNSRSIKNGKDLYILDNCTATAVIIECGFLSNEVECKKLCEKEYQKELSFAISCGIIEYIEGLENTD